MSSGTSSDSEPTATASLASRAGAAQQRLDARDQDLGAERLAQVVVGAEGERAHDVGFLAARRQHHQRNSAALAQLLREIEAAHARHVDVEHGEMRLLALECVERRHAVRGFHDEEAGLLQARNPSPRADRGRRRREGFSCRRFLRQLDSGARAPLLRSLEADGPAMPLDDRADDE